MTQQEAMRRLSDLEYGDPEASHSEADDILVAYLTENGAEDVAIAWIDAKERCRFWYA